MESKHHYWGMFILRAGLAFAFLYPAISAIFSPYDWIGYFPDFMKGYVPDMVLLHVFGATEAVIGFWILSGKRIFIPSLLATIYLALIVVLNYQGFQVLFRDISILAMAVSLMMFSCTCKYCQTRPQ